MMRAIRSILALGLSWIAASTPGAAPAVPTPESVLGFAPCADYKLATYEEIAGYLQKLDAASDRMQLVDIGKTTEGRTELLAIISSEQNMRNLAKYKDVARRLALARDLTDEQARTLARDGKAIAWIDFGLHSTEVAHGQTAPLMAYKAVTDDSDEMRTIRDNVIFLLQPNMNPDGTTLVARWYMDHVGTPYEKSSPPALYQKYIGHDNNRDWFMFNMPESRNVARQLYEEWFPQIVYNQHQTGPFPSRIFVPPFDDPMNPNIPPIVMRGVNTVGDAITRRLDQEGKRGAVSRIEFDTWWNGGMRSAPYFHNMVGILTETGHASATPANYDPATFPRTFSNGVSTLEPSTYYPSPYLGGEWHLRDSCDIMVTASMAVLDIGAKRRQEWLYDAYQMGRDAIRAGAHETYVVPAEQWDPGTAVKMINTLRLGGVEVDRATAAFESGGKQYGAGSFVVRGSQAFLAYIRDLLNPQVYPDQRLYPGGPPERPYDITGWTLPQQMGVQVDKLTDAVSATVERVSLAPPSTGSVSNGEPAAYAIDPRANDAFRAANRLLKAGESVYRTDQPIRVEDTEWPAGAFLVARAAATRDRITSVARELGLQVKSAARPSADLFKMKQARVGLYQAWGGNIDEGWTRWLLEQFEFPYTTMHDTDIRDGNLESRFDVIVLPDATYDNMLLGLPAGSMPPEFTGGMTAPGVSHLYSFVSHGGVLVCMDSASELPLTAFGLPLRNVLNGRPASEFYVPGTLVRIHLDTSQPVAYGMPSDGVAFFSHSPAFAIGRRPRPAIDDDDGGDSTTPSGVHVVARYPESGLLTSGWLLGERFLVNQAAVVDAALDRGRVILLGFRTQHRGQSHGTFKLLFNSIMLGGYEKASFPTHTAAANQSPQSAPTGTGR
jgi:hypothetical protein